MTVPSLQPLVFKIVNAESWRQAELDGVFNGAPVDIQDGYIHFSAVHQVRGTARRHFAGLPDLLLVAVDTARLGDALLWEPSRGGDLFPHLYGPLQMNAVVSVEPLPLGDDGQHLLPNGL